MNPGRERSAGPGRADCSRLSANEAGRLTVGCYGPAVCAVATWTRSDHVSALVNVDAIQDDHNRGGRIA